MITPVIGSWYDASIHCYGADVRVDALTTDVYGQPAVMAWVPFSQKWERLQVCKLVRESTSPEQQEAVLRRILAEPNRQSPPLEPLRDECWEPLKRLPCDVRVSRQGTHFTLGDHGSMS